MAEKSNREWSKKIDSGRAELDEIAEQHPRVPAAIEMFDALFGANPELDLKIAAQAQKIRDKAAAIADASQTNE